MANLSIAPQSITFEGITGLYHFFHHEARDAVSAKHLTDFVERIKLSVFPPDKSKVPAHFQSATSALAELVKVVKRDENGIASPYNGLDHRITLLKLARKNFAEQVSGLRTDNLSVLIKRVVEVVKDHFNDKDVEQVFRSEAERQQNMIKNSQLFLGLAGIYEICLKRPNLGYDLIKRSTDLSFLSAMKNHLMKVIGSFSSKDNSSQQNEGIYHFGRLIHEIGVNKGVFQGLCVEDSDAQFFVHSALKASPEEHLALYHQFRTAVLSQFPGGFAESHQVVELIGNKAEEISARVPDTYKGSSKVVGTQIASSFRRHADHGNGALLFGRENFGVRLLSQWFGEGPKEGPTPVGFDPTNRASLDNTQASEALKQKIRKQVTQAVKDYYESHKLISYRYQVHSANFIEEIPLTNEAEKALGTVEVVVGEKINQHIRENGIMFGLDARERQNLGREKAKEVILFGIQNNIFSPFPLLLVCREYGITEEDQGPIGEKLRAILSEPEALRRSMEEYARTQPPEAMEILRGMGSTDPNESKRG